MPPTAFLAIRYDLWPTSKLVLYSYIESFAVLDFDKNIVSSRMLGVNCKSYLILFL